MAKSCTYQDELGNGGGAWRCLTYSVSGRGFKFGQPLNKQARGCTSVKMWSPNKDAKVSLYARPTAHKAGVPAGRPRISQRCNSLTDFSSGVDKVDLCLTDHNDTNGCREAHINTYIHTVLRQEERP